MRCRCHIRTNGSFRPSDLRFYLSQVSFAELLGALTRLIKVYKDPVCSCGGDQLASVVICKRNYVVLNVSNR